MKTVVVQTSLAASLVLQGGQDVKSRFQAGLQCIKSMPLAAHQGTLRVDGSGLLFQHESTHLNTIAFEPEQILYAGAPRHPHHVCPSPSARTTVAIATTVPAHPQPMLHLTRRALCKLACILVENPSGCQLLAFQSRVRGDASAVIKAAKALIQTEHRPQSAKVISPNCSPISVTPEKILPPRSRHSWLAASSRPSSAGQGSPALSASSSLGDIADLPLASRRSSELPSDRVSLPSIHSSEADLDGFPADSASSSGSHHRRPSVQSLAPAARYWPAHELPCHHKLDDDALELFAAALREAQLQRSTHHPAKDDEARERLCLRRLKRPLRSIQADIPAMLGLVLTYRVVFTPLEFLNYLQDCLERFPSATYAVLELSLLWVSVCHSDLLHDDLTRHSFEAWCEQHMGSEWAWLLQEIRLVVQLQDRATAARKPVDATATADKHYGPTPGILDQLEPDTVANQLTLFDEQLFTVLTVDDYLTAMARAYKMESQQHAPGHSAHSSALQAAMDRFQQEIAWVKAEILLGTAEKEWLSKYLLMLRVADKCCQLGNLFSVFSIYSALDSVEVSRKMATVRLADKHRKLFARLARLTDPSRNMANYRRQLEQFHNKPCIPFLPVHLKDLLFATETRRTLSRDSADLVTKILMSVQSQQAFPMRTDFGMQSYLRVSVPRAALPALPSKAELAPDTQAAQVRRQYLLAELTSPAKGGANKGATTERKPKRSSLTIVVAAAADAEADGGSTDGPLSARTNSVHAFMPPPRRFSKMSSTSLSALPEQARTPLRPKLSDASLEATPHRLSETWSLPRSSAVTSYSRRSSMLSASDCMDSSEDERHDDLSLVSTRSAPEPGTGHGLSSPDPADASLATRRQVANLEPLSTSLSLPRHFFDGAAPRTAPSPLGATMESASASINSWLAPSSAAYNMSSTTNERPFTASKLVLDFSMSSLAAEGTAEAREARQSEGSASSVVSSVFETEPLPSVSCPLEGPDWIEIDLDAEDTILESVEVLGGRVSLV